jgi:hypothetical protein
VPALRAKDVALAIQALLARQETAQAPRRNALETHVKQLVVAAYQLDNFGDLGNAEKIREAYSQLFDRRDRHRIAGSRAE